MSSSIIGQPVTRIDGKLKVTGSSTVRDGTRHRQRRLRHSGDQHHCQRTDRQYRLQAPPRICPECWAVIHHGNVEPLVSPGAGIREDGARGRNPASV